MEINGETRMAAVIAKPIKHSLSPFIHNRAFELTDVNGVYLAWEVEEKELAQTLGNIRLLNMYGVNLSMPFKQLAMWYVTELSDEARLIGAINTIVNHDGMLKGYNTDGIGFFKALKVHGFSVLDQDITVLGGGGSALAIIVQAAILKAGKITVFARPSESYKPLEKKLATISDLTKARIDLHDLTDSATLQTSINQSSLLVNATSVGMDGHSSPVPPILTVPRDLLVADVIYKVAETSFLKWAALQGARTVNGLGMLLYQAAESFELWTGQKFPVQGVGSALLTHF